MFHVSVRCYAELNDFLSPEQRFVTFPLVLPQGISVEALLEEIGITPQVIDLVLVNGNSVGMLHKLAKNDRVTLYPVFESFDIASITKLQNSPLRRPRFILDVHLGKLAHYLRMFGFDTLYQNDYTNYMLCTLSVKEHRILLSKNHTLVKNESITHAHLVKNENSRAQLVEVFELLDLYSLSTPFTRCIDCNSMLQQIDKHSILSRIPQSVIDWCDDYLLCPGCNRIYWKGSHYQHMNKFVQHIINRSI
jgi:uncharacterized protein with PIN domain/sulfur carrier protein ThiS